MVEFSQHFATARVFAGNVQTLRDWAAEVLPLALGVAGPFEPFDRHSFDEFQGYAGQGDAFVDRSNGERYRLGTPTAGVLVDEFFYYRVLGSEEGKREKWDIFHRGAWLRSDPREGSATLEVRVGDGGLLFRWVLDEPTHTAVLAATERVMAGREDRGNA